MGIYKNNRAAVSTGNIFSYDDMIVADTSGGAFTLTLPHITTGNILTGYKVLISDINTTFNSTNKLTISTSSGDGSTLFGGTSTDLTTPGQSLYFELAPNNTWRVLRQLNTLQEVSGTEILGWVAITDTTYTSGSPFTILSGVDTVLRWNVDSFIDTYAPDLYDNTDYFDDVNWRVNSPILGAAYDYRLRFKCVPSANTKVLTTSFSIGTGVGSQIVIDDRSTDLRTSGVATSVSMTSLIYSLDTFIANGMEVILNANTDCDIYDIGMVINRTS